MREPIFSPDRGVVRTDRFSTFGERKKHDRVLRQQRQQFENASPAFSLYDERKSF